MLNVVIIEDEIHSRETLKTLLTEFCEDVNVMGMTGSVEEAVALINQLQPELVFLDIELQTGTGFDVLNQVDQRNFEVIFTTAFEHYAIKAIKFSSIDYLLKPIDLDELQEALRKARQKKDQLLTTRQLDLLLKNIANKTDQKRKICLSTADGLEFIEVGNITYCEANGSYTNFHIKPNVRLVVSKNLKEYEQMLADYDFMRVHNSFLINLHEVKKFVKSEGGYILMNNEAQISISPSKRDTFLRLMAKLF